MLENLIYVNTAFIGRKLFAELIAAAERLLRICRGLEGHPNKVLQQYTKAIDKLSDSMEK